jgi:hypothetical protein
MQKALRAEDLRGILVDGLMPYPFCRSPFDGQTTVSHPRETEIFRSPLKPGTQGHEETSS